MLLEDEAARLQSKKSLYSRTEIICEEHSDEENPETIVTFCGPEELTEEEIVVPVAIKASNSN